MHLLSDQDPQRKHSARAQPSMRQPPAGRVQGETEVGRGAAGGGGQEGCGSRGSFCSPRASAEPGLCLQDGLQELEVKVSRV